MYHGDTALRGRLGEAARGKKWAWSSGSCSKEKDSSISERRDRGQQQGSLRLTCWGDTGIGQAGY